MNYLNHWLRSTTKPTRLARCFLALSPSFVTPTALAAILADTDLVVVDGDASPDGNGVVDFAGTLHAVSLAESGTTAFRVNLADTETVNGGSSNSAVMIASSTNLQIVARERNTAPGGGLYDDLKLANDSGLAINSSNQVAFTGETFTTGVGGSPDVFFRGDAALGGTRVATEGEIEPGDNGVLTLSRVSSLPINSSGQVAFSARLSDTSGGGDDDRALYLSNGDSTPLTQVVREGQGAPDGDGFFGPYGGSSQIANPTVNSSGQVAFTGLVRDSTNRGDGVFRYDDGELTEIIREGDLLPNGETYARQTFSANPINSSGQVGFVASYQGTGSGNEGVFLGDGLTITTIAATGQQVDGVNQTLRNVSRTFDMNENTEFVFAGDVNGIPQRSGHSNALMFGDGDTLETIAFDGLLIPEGGAFFGFDRSYAINDASQVAFEAGIDLDPSDVSVADTRGLFFYDKDSELLTEVVRLGDLIMGEEITDFQFAGNSSNQYLTQEQDGINNLGQVAYWFRLESGNSGIAIATVPEPSTFALTFLGLLGLLRPRSV